MGGEGVVEWRDGHGCGAGAGGKRGGWGGVVGVGCGGCGGMWWDVVGVGCVGVVGV